MGCGFPSLQFRQVGTDSVTFIIILGSNVQNLTINLQEQSKDVIIECWDSPWDRLWRFVI